MEEKSPSPPPASPCPFSLTPQRERSSQSLLEVVVSSLLLFQRQLCVLCQSITQSRDGRIEAQNRRLSNRSDLSCVRSPSILFSLSLSLYLLFSTAPIQEKDTNERAREEGTEKKKSLWYLFFSWCRGGGGEEEESSDNNNNPKKVDENNFESISFPLCGESVCVKSEFSHHTTTKSDPVCAMPC